MKPVIIISTAVIIVVTVFIRYYMMAETDINNEARDAVPVISSQDWKWENPYTYKQAIIPADWKQKVNAELEETVLTLEHESGKSLIYILYEEPVEYMTLAEYIEAIKPLNKKEFGIEEFNEVTDKDGNNYYQADSARYLGDKMVGISVRIWGDGINSFWETVQMTDLEYKSIEYNAREVVKLLIETTL